MTRTLALEDIQGNIASGYRKYPHFDQLFGTITPENAGRWSRFLGELGRQKLLTCGSQELGPSAINLGISYAGLEQLVPQLARAIRKAFPAYAAGMAARSASLGDAANLDWATWQRRHVWLAVYGADLAQVKDVTEKLKKAADDATLTLTGGLLPGFVLENESGRIEHFGFRDGISNPVFHGGGGSRQLAGNGKRNPETNEWEPIATGEFLLGYANEQGRNVLDAVPALAPVFADGTFSVLRVLEQHVERFHEYLDTVEQRYGLDPLQAASKMVGRTPDGRPLTAPEKGNDFDYNRDREGARCPMGAHIRRANPRIDGEHRLLRRSVPYGPFLERKGAPLKAERGVYFIAMNASIEDQFEFLQKNYLNGEADGRTGFGRVSAGRDPLAASGGGSRRMAIEGDVATSTLPVLLLDIPAFVTCRGGEYYFTPSIPALAALARLGRVEEKEHAAPRTRSAAAGGSP